MQLWLAFSHAEANAVLRDRRLGRIWADKEPAGRFESFNLVHRNAILEMEPPDHTRLRRLMSAAFARGHVERLRPWVQQLAGRLVDGMVERSGGREPVDVLTRMADQLPVAVIAELLGVPEADRPLLRPWSNAIVKMYEYGRTTEIEDAAERAADEFVAYLRGLADERRRAPGEDLLSHLVSVRDAEGDRLTEDELVTTCILLLNAGHEATVNVSGNGLLALLAHPDQLRRLRVDHSLLPTAIEELMRFDSPSSCSSAPPRRTSRSAGSRSGRVRRSPRCWVRPTTTPPSSQRRRPSTSGGPRTRTSPSAPASTSASAHHWPGWSCWRRSARCSTAGRPSNSGQSRSAARSSSSAASRSCPSSSPADLWPSGPPLGR